MSENKPANGSGPKPADREVRAFPFTVEDVRAAEGGRSTDFTIRGHASVFNTWYDLGFFRERVAKGAFDNVLSRDPHVVHTWDHDTSKALSSTRSNPVTLELRTDPKGLHFWSRVDGELSYAKDLRRLVEKGIVSQSSFAFTVAKDEWKITGEGADEVVERTIVEVGELYDVTTTAMGASPTTDSQVAGRTLERARAVAEGLPDSPPAETPDDTAPEEEVAVEGTDAPPDHEDGAASEESAAAQEPNPAARARAEMELLKRSAREGTERLQEAQYQILKEMWRK